MKEVRVKVAGFRPALTRMFVLGSATGVAATVVLVGILINWKRHHLQGVLPNDTIAGQYIPPGTRPPPQPAFLGPLLGQLPQLPKSVHVPIVLYHYVEYNRDPKDTFRTKLTVTPFWFEKQLEWLKTNGYESITPHDLTEAIAGRGKLSAKAVILTFDDGYRDFYTDAYPLLKKYQMKATIYVVPGFLDQPNYLFTWQLTEIATASADLINIGAHTVHHAALTAEKPDRAREEIAGSRRQLQEIVGRSVRDFAYPYGLFNPEVVGLVKEAGFESAVSTVFGTTEGKENLYYLPRVRVGDYAGELFASRLR